MDFGGTEDAGSETPESLERLGAGLGANTIHKLSAGHAWGHRTTAHLRPQAILRGRTREPTNRLRMPPRPEVIRIYLRREFLLTLR